MELDLCENDDLKPRLKIPSKLRQSRDLLDKKTKVYVGGPEESSKSTSLRIAHTTIRL